MRVKTVDEVTRSAEILSDVGEAEHDTAERIHEALLMVAYSITTKEIPGGVFVTWVPWPDHKKKTTLTAAEALEKVKVERGTSRSAFSASVRNTLATRKARVR